MKFVWIKLIKSTFTWCCYQINTSNRKWVFKRNPQVAYGWNSVWRQPTWSIERLRVQKHVWTHQMMNQTYSKHIAKLSLLAKCKLAKQITWLWTALNMAGPILSRTSLPLSKLAITSICITQKDQVTQHAIINDK